jgi:SAM-dependent methyltransferase
MMIDVGGNPTENQPAKIATEDRHLFILPKYTLYTGEMQFDYPSIPLILPTEIMDMDLTIDKIRDYWDQRGREFGEDGRATLGERHLRELEIRVMIRFLNKLKPFRVLDVGCGNGYSTKKFGNAFPRTEFLGMDYSQEMINAANRVRVQNCRFVRGDVLQPETIPPGAFDVILTQRCLQNLPTYDLQRRAIGNLLDKLTPAGTLLLMECSKDGVLQLNSWRIVLRKKPIDDIEPWYNNFFSDAALMTDFGAKVVHFSSSYMFISKLIHPRLSFLGLVLPQLGWFGYDKLYVLRPTARCR